MDFVLQKTAAGALLPETLLHGNLRILGIIGVDERGITYEAENDGKPVAVREHFPMAIASRDGLDVTCEEADIAALKDSSKEFLRISKVLRKGLPHFAAVTDTFQENHTEYLVTALPEEGRLGDVPVTATYVQSLGIALCESFAALHKAKLYYGILREEHLHFAKDGALRLSSDPIRTSGSEAEDLHSLKAFLAALLPTEEEDETAVLLQNALQLPYSDTNSLKAALLGEKPSRSGNRTGLLCLLLCIFFLAVGLFLFRQIPEKAVTLSDGLESGKIMPEVIHVWLPLETGADEKSVCAMYERLAAGFERRNPGCGVNIRIYADDSFGEALALLEESDIQPAVFMDTQDEIIQEKAADLHTLTEALEDVYMTDLNRFEKILPLGCSVPAVFYNSHYGESEWGLLSYNELPEDTLFDSSAADFLSRQNDAPKTKDCFGDFLADGSHPVLASSSRMAEAEHSGISVGAVHMLPLSAAEGFPLQYEMYCAINTESDANSQRVGMLWLQYLLTEEAQQILFVEHYGILPLHKNAFSSAVEVHSELAALKNADAAEPASPENETEVES